MLKNKKGFTLIELIIVIAIIAILAAVLIPTMTNAVNDANVASTKNNISGAIGDYESDLVTKLSNTGDGYATAADAKAAFAGFLGVDSTAIVAAPAAKGQYGVVLDADNHITSASFWLKSVTYTYTVSSKTWS
jgi:type IV pilus assembly protein PilA